MPCRAKDLTGLRVGRLTVIERAPSLPGNRGARWLAMCECGGQTVSRSDRLTSGKANSCGCLSAEVAVKTHTKHGLSKSREYLAWVNMRGRCSGRDHKCWPNYGGRGITVCQKWDASFEAFYQDVGPSPGKGFELDRIDNDGNYEPGNCRWVTKAENNANRRPRKDRRQAR